MPTDLTVDASALASVALNESVSAWVAGHLREARRLWTTPLALFEVGNALWKWRRKIPDGDERLRLFWKLGLEEHFDAETAQLALLVAERNGVTFYDASYIALALNREAPLVTLDRLQAKAARAEGVAVIEPNE